VVAEIDPHSFSLSLSLAYSLYLIQTAHNPDRPCNTLSSLSCTLILDPKSHAVL